MGGDYSRLTFQPGKHFVAVLLQQGRVQLDSDWNEAEAIRRHRERTLIRDLLGPAAFAGDGFAVSAHGAKLTIAAGHAWIDGSLCELARDTEADAQPDLPGARLPTDDGIHLVYLDVWEREVTAVEDETLLEPALGGPDTSVRVTTVAQVRSRRVPGHARRDRDWSVPVEATDAMLAVTGRYEGLENRLYRIEIHKDADEPTFKYSRDNGSTTAAIRSWTPSELVVRPAQPSFAPGDHLEVIDRHTILERRPGTFVKVGAIAGDRLAVTPVDDPVPDSLVDPLVRRWDGLPMPVRATQDQRIELEDGLEVHFAGSTFRAGDYWLFAARTADASVEWPDAAPAADPHPPLGIEVHRVALAVVRRSKKGWTVLRDLRRLIPR
jgi:hypothetical protein